MHYVDNYVDKSEVMHKLWISFVDKMWITFKLYYSTNTLFELYRDSIYRSAIYNSPAVVVVHNLDMQQGVIVWKVAKMYKKQVYH